MGKFGYAGKILKVDLSSGGTAEIPTDEYADRFIGGRGIAAKIYWDEVTPQISAFDPANLLVFMTGPVAGFTRLAGSRWQVCGKSPAMDPGVFSYANLGGSWGSRLKFAGYDGLVIQGSAEKPVYLFVHDGTAEIRDASHLWDKTTTEARQRLQEALGKDVRVAAIGPAGENLVSFATLLADDDASGSAGFGGVMGAKRLKAIAVTGNERPKAASYGNVQRLCDSIFRLRKGTWEVYPPVVEGRTKRQICYGCVSGCLRQYYKTDDRRRIKVFCQAGDFYRRPALKYYGGWNEVIVHAIRLSNEYGLDTIVIQPMMEWLYKCCQEGILRDEETDIPLSKFGSYEFIETLVRKISFRQGFGDVLAQGTIKAAETVGKGSEKLIGESIATRANEMSDYDPRLYIITGLLFAFEPRRPIQQIHEVTFTMLQWLEWLKGGKEGFLSTDVLQAIAEKFWGGKAAVDFSTYKGKAVAAKKIQDRAYAKDSLILCDFLWPIIWVRYSEDHVGDPSLQSQVFSAIVGRETDERELNQIGERIFNLQRAILMREGWGGREGDRLPDYVHEGALRELHLNRECLVPGKKGKTTSRKGKKLTRKRFEKLKDEYYGLRGWDVESGLQTRTRLEELGLGDVADDLEKRGLLK